MIGKKETGWMGEFKAPRQDQRQSCQQPVFKRPREQLQLSPLLLSSSLLLLVAYATVVSCLGNLILSARSSLEKRIGRSCISDSDEFSSRELLV